MSSYLTHTHTHTRAHTHYMHTYLQRGQGNKSVVDYLLSICRALSSVPSTDKKERRKERREGTGGEKKGEDKDDSTTVFPSGWEGTPHSTDRAKENQESRALLGL